VFIDYCATPETEPAEFIVSCAIRAEASIRTRVKDPLAHENMLSDERARRVSDSPVHGRVSIRRMPQGGMEMRMTKRIRPSA
jgi:hypothetical protein